MQQEKQFTIIIRSPSFEDPFPIKLDPENLGTASDIRNIISKHVNRIPEHIKVLLKGRILENQKLSQLNISNNEILHAVIKKENKNDDDKKKEEFVFDEQKYTEGLEDLGLEGKVTRDFIDREVVKQKMSQVTPDVMKKVVAKNSLLQQMIAKNPQLNSIFQDEESLQEFFRPELVHAALNQIYGIEGMEEFYSDEQVEQQFEGIKRKKKVRPHDLYKKQMIELRKFGFLNETQNIETLIETKGDLQAAKKILMQE